MMISTLRVKYRNRYRCYAKLFRQPKREVAVLLIGYIIISNRLKIRSVARQQFKPRLLHSPAKMIAFLLKEARQVQVMILVFQIFGNCILQRGINAENNKLVYLPKFLR